MSTPLISIIIPCYNAEKWLVESVNSALGQSWKNVEVIVVDDGSTDDSVEILRRNFGDKITLITQTNSGASAARNRGLEVSSGEFIQFLDADDLLSPDKIQLQMQVLENQRDCIASCSWGRFRENISTVEFRSDELWQDLYPVEWLVTSWTMRKMMHPAAWLVPRKILEKSGKWDETLSLDDDGEFFVRAVLAAKKVIFVREAKTYYRSGIVGTLSGNVSRKGAESRMAVVEKSVSELLRVESTPRTRNASSDYFKRAAFSLYPIARDLAIAADRRSAELGNSKLSVPGGKYIRLTSNLLGWKRAIALREAVRSAKRKTPFK